MAKVMMAKMHVYECEECVVAFAVDQDFEGQCIVMCPVCCEQDYIRDVGSGTIVIKPNEEGTE